MRGDQRGRSFTLSQTTVCARSQNGFHKTTEKLNERYLFKDEGGMANL